MGSTLVKLSAENFFKINVFQKTFSNTTRFSKCLDQDEHFVGTDLGPSCLQYLPEPHHGLVRILSSTRCLIRVFTIRSQTGPLKVQ